MKLKLVLGLNGIKNMEPTYEEPEYDKHPEYKWTCYLCYPGASEIGMICGGYALILWEGKYHILGGQGHLGHIEYSFENKPFPDPDPECAEELDPEDEALSERWLDMMEHLSKNLKMDPYTGHELIERCLVVGYDPEEHSFDCWLLDRCGQLIKNWETNENRL